MKVILSAFLTLLVSLPAFSTSITLPFNTGVTSSGSLAAGGSLDINYSSAESALTSAFVLANPPYWAWLAPDVASAWIGPDSESGASFKGGFYTTDYVVNLNLTDYNPSSIVLTGSVAVDNTLNDIYVNGVSSGISASNFGSWTSFTINKGFTSNLNTIDFNFTNDGGPGGVRVEFVGGSGTRLSPTPEPSVSIIVGACIMCLGLWRRRVRC